MSSLLDQDKKLVKDSILVASQTIHTGNDGVLKLKEQNKQFDRINEDLVDIDVNQKETKKLLYKIQHFFPSPKGLFKKNEVKHSKKEFQSKVKNEKKFLEKQNKKKSKEKHKKNHLTKKQKEHEKFIQESAYDKSLDEDLQLLDKHVTQLNTIAQEMSNEIDQVTLNLNVCETTTQLQHDKMKAQRKEIQSIIS
ncbi:hypothetical protein QTN25_008816 [Entamoeba marina]